MTQMRLLSTKYKGQAGCWLVMIIFFGLMIWVIIGAIQVEQWKQSPEGKEKLANEQRCLCTPRFVSESDDGTKLYRVSHSCNQVGGSYDVFFSKSGTQLEWETRHHVGGKTSHTRIEHHVTRIPND